MKEIYTKRSFGIKAVAGSALLHGALVAVAIGLSLPAEPLGDFAALDVITVSPDAVGIHDPALPVAEPAKADSDGTASVPQIAPPQTQTEPLFTPEPAPPQRAAPAAKQPSPNDAPAGTAAVTATPAPAPGSGVTVLFGNPPAYPPGARREGLQGRVVVRVTLNAGEGAPFQLRLAQSSGYPVLDKAALEAVAQWRFRASGKVELDVPIQFKLEDANR